MDIREAAKALVAAMNDRPVCYECGARLDDGAEHLVECEVYALMDALAAGPMPTPQLTESVAIAIANDAFAVSREMDDDGEDIAEALAAIVARHLATNADAVAERERALVRATHQRNAFARELTDAECDRIIASVGSQ